MHSEITNRPDGKERRGINNKKKLLNTKTVIKIIQNYSNHSVMKTKIIVNEEIITQRDQWSEKGGSQK